MSLAKFTSYRVGFLPSLLAPFATLLSLLEAGGSTSKMLKPIRDDFEDLPENTNWRYRCKRYFVVFVLVRW